MTSWGQLPIINRCLCQSPLTCPISSTKVIGWSELYKWAWCTFPQKIFHNATWMLIVNILRINSCKNVMTQIHRQNWQPEEYISKIDSRKNIDHIYIIFPEIDWGDCLDFYVLGTRGCQFLTFSQVCFWGNDQTCGNDGMMKSHFIQFLLQKVSSNPYFRPFCLMAVSWALLLCDCQHFDGAIQFLWCDLKIYCIP